LTLTKDALTAIIRQHTREAGVRNLEREIANLARKAVKEIVSNKTKSITITHDNVDTYAGVRQYRYGEMEGEDSVGVVTGLAWTEAGGDTLQIESVMLPGKGRMQTSAPRRRPSASSRRRSKRSTSTSTCRKAQRPRTDLRPA
jgi:ATP-dependent Lon protease